MMFFERKLLQQWCILSQRADLRWRRSMEDMHELADLQDSLLDAAALYGILHF